MAQTIREPRIPDLSRKTPFGALLDRSDIPPEEPATQDETLGPSSSTPAPTPAKPAKTKSQAKAFKIHVTLTDAELRRIDDEIYRRRKAGIRGRGKADYAAIVREALEHYWNTRPAH